MGQGKEVGTGVRERRLGVGGGGEGGSFICPLNEGQVDQGRPLNTREGEKIEIVGEERVGQRPPAMPEMPNRGRTRLLLSDRGTNMDLFSLSLSPSLPLPLAGYTETKAKLDNRLGKGTRLPVHT